MRHVASPVTVVTTPGGGAPRGATIGSFTSVSLAPPLVAFNVIRGTAFHAALLRDNVFAVHVLAEDQAGLAERFAQPDVPSEALFEGLALRPEAAPLPVLAEVPAVLRARLWAVYDGGDHDVVVGEVDRVWEEGPARRPLLYYARGYHALGPRV